MSRRIDIHNQRFGALTALLPVQRQGLCGNGVQHWLCRCDCGNVLVVRGDNLRSGNTQSCSRCGDSWDDRRSKFVKGKKIR